MAIDTAEKRKSISGIQHFMMAGVTPNATMDQEWRQESGWGYPGILADNPAPVVPVTTQPLFLLDVGTFINP